MNFIILLLIIMVWLFQVAWLHVGRQMLLTIHTHVVVKIPRFSVSYDKQKTWFLRIQNVQQNDRGYYMCQVNTVPMISQVGYLQVVGKFFLFYLCNGTDRKSNFYKYCIFKFPLWTLKIFKKKSLISVRFSKIELSSHLDILKS